MSEPSRANPAAVMAMLARREWLRLARQPARIVAAIGTALLLWLVVGGGLGGSMRLGGTAPTEAANDPVSYALYLVPGVMTVVAMFAAIFSSIAVIEDRREGFLQGVLVAPAPRWSIATGIVPGGASVAAAQAALLLPLAWVAGPAIDLPRAGLALVGVLLAAVALQSLGVAFAWRCRDAASFHSVMNLLFMPLWLLSDAFFPVRGAAEPLATIIRINPLSWCGAVVREALLGGPLPGLALLGAAAFAAASLGVAVTVVARGRG